MHGYIYKRPLANRAINLGTRGDSRRAAAAAAATRGEAVTAGGRLRSTAAELLM